MAPMRSESVSKIHSLFTDAGWTRETPSIYLSPDRITSFPVDIDPDYCTVVFEFFLECLRERGLGDLADRFHERINHV